MMNVGQIDWHLQVNLTNSKHIEIKKIASQFLIMIIVILFKAHKLSDKK